MDGVAALERASALCDLGRWDDAARRLRTILATDPHNEYGLCLLAQAQYMQADTQAAYDEALRTSLTAISVNPENEWSHRLASVALLQLGREQEAYAMGREAVRLAPNVAACHTNLAEMLAWSQADRDEARAAADRAVVLAPNDPASHIAVGVVVGAVPAGRRKAAAAYHRALALDPENSRAHHQLAQSRLVSGRDGNTGALAQAAGGFADALRTNPSSSENRHNFDLCVHQFLHHVFNAMLLVVVFAPAAPLYFVKNGNAVLGRGLGVFLLAVPALVVGRFVSVLAPRLRGHLISVLRSPLNAGALLCQALAATVLVVGAIFQRANLIACCCALALVLLSRPILWLRNRSRFGSRIPVRRNLWMVIPLLVVLLILVLPRPR